MKKIWQWVIIVPILIGVILGLYLTFTKHIQNSEENEKVEQVFGNAMTKSAEIIKFYTYGTSLNIEGKITGISKDNYEGLRIIITDGASYNKEYKVDTSFSEENLNFSTSNSMNDAIDLENLEPAKYYVQIRLKVNNSKDYRYYLLSNSSEYKDIEYYTLTKDGTNKKVNIKFEEKEYNKKKYSYLGLNVENSELPEDVYDFAIDAACGGKDDGEKYSTYTESALMLDYANLLKTSLESNGYKVKLTRDLDNTSSFTATNMYDDGGRIDIACKSKAKYMISLHLNGTSSSGVEVYSPSNCNLDLPKKIADNIYNMTNVEYSNSSAYKKLDGVYVKTFTKQGIADLAVSAKNKGFEPYSITTSTPSQYTIREVGGIATNAYVDGRNTSYGKNKYYNSNQGIECYQISLGGIKNDLDTILNQKENYINAITEAFIK